jgi:signal transduction histidine kinase
MKNSRKKLNRFDSKKLYKYTHQLRLLYVDDSKTARRFFETILKPYFKEIDLAEDGDVGLQIFNKKRNDIVITDINMPNLSGIEMARFIKRIDHNTPVILTTSFSEEHFLIESIKIGVNGYIKKSANPEELLETVYESAKILFQQIELEKREKIMIQQSKLSSMGELLINIAHQWRQPLNFMGLTLEDLRGTYEDGELDGEYLEGVISDTNKFLRNMSETIDQFANYFAPEHTKERFKVVDAVKEALKMQGISAEGSKIGTFLEISETLQLNTYRQSFVQSLMHILKNSKEAIEKTEPEEALIQIKAMKIDRGLDEKFVIEICDTGGGIDEGIAEKIFDPYFTTQFQTQGRGMGLYISKITVEEHLLGHLTASNKTFFLNGQDLRGACLKIELS